MGATISRTIFNCKLTCYKLYYLYLEPFIPQLPQFSWPQIRRIGVYDFSNFIPPIWCLIRDFFLHTLPHLALELYKLIKRLFIFSSKAAILAVPCFLAFILWTDLFTTPQHNDHTAQLYNDQWIRTLANHDLLQKNFHAANPGEFLTESAV